MTYRVNDLYATVQGEGCQTGVPMVLIRLQGCPVGCPWCDTKETWAVDPADRVAALPAALGTSRRWAEVDAAALAAEARRAGGEIRWALVTGGEPAEQPLRELVTALHTEGFKAAVETSGTATGHVGAGFDWVCVSPKIHMPGGLPVLTEAVAEADEIKHVIAKPADLLQLAALLDRVTLKPSCQICLQPVSQSARATELCVAEVKKRGWRLSLQMHKYLNER